ncbi:MAG TPA: restriction endonuclease [Azoarcus sp.]|nr:restriction endonuclease [Azoarcus sp.]
MAIPDFQTLMRPVLEYASAAPERRLRDTYAAMADRFELSEEERREMLPSGRALLMHNRVAWAVTHLKKAGMLNPVRRGVFAITERGKKALFEAPERITLQYLMRFDDFRDFRNKRNADFGRADGESDTRSGDLLTEDQTPEEKLATAWKTIRADLELEILEQVKEMSPAFFERLVLDVLISMGYGGERADAARAVGQSGDGGIDGIIDEDPLGLDIIYLQAKRWESIVGRPEIQKFAGALQGRRARKGVFITTSGFSKDALEYANMIETRIILIEGRRLARLMIDHGVGVSETSTYVIKQLDSDYFSED